MLQQTQGPCQHLSPQMHRTLPCPNPGQDEEEAPYDMPEEPPAKSRSRWSRLSKRPFLKIPKWWGQHSQPTVRPTSQSLNKKGCMIWLWYSGRWPGIWTPSTVKYMRCRRSGPAGEGSRPPTVLYKLPQRTSNSSAWYHQMSCPTLWG